MRQSEIDVLVKRHFRCPVCGKEVDAALVNPAPYVIRYKAGPHISTPKGYTLYQPCGHKVDMK